MNITKKRLQIYRNIYSKMWKSQFRKMNSTEIALFSGMLKGYRSPQESKLSLKFSTSRQKILRQQYKTLDKCPFLCKLQYEKHNQYVEGDTARWSDLCCIVLISSCIILGTSNIINWILSFDPSASAEIWLNDLISSDDKSHLYAMLRWMCWLCAQTNTQEHTARYP